MAWKASWAALFNNNWIVSVSSAPLLPTQLSVFLGCCSPCGGWKWLHFHCRLQCGQEQRHAPAVAGGGHLEHACSAGRNSASRLHLDATETGKCCLSFWIAICAAKKVTAMEERTDIGGQLAIYCSAPFLCFHLPFLSFAFILRIVSLCFYKLCSQCADQLGESWLLSHPPELHPYLECQPLKSLCLCRSQGRFSFPNMGS